MPSFRRGYVLYALKRVKFLCSIKINISKRDCALISGIYLFICIIFVLGCHVSTFVHYSKEISRMHDTVYCFRIKQAMMASSKL